MKFTNLILLFVLVVISMFTASAQNDLSEDVIKFEKFITSLDEKYVDSVATHSLIEAGMRKMLEELDPHSVYLDREAYQRATEPLKGKYQGIGIRYEIIDDTITLTDVMKGTPAGKAKLEIGDQIVVINDDTVSGMGMSTPELNSLLKDRDMRKYQMIVNRKDVFYQSLFSVTKGDVAIKSVPAYFMVNQKTGYIKLSRFSATSLDEFRKAFDKLEKKKMRRLILDLRGNGGGYLNVAIKIADEFFEDRKLIVYTEGLHQPRRETYATSGGRFIEGDLIILIDQNSASASEILAGAVQDLDRGLIIGRRSYGKGLVQRTIEFNDGSAMRLTMSRYYTPTGRSIQRPYEKDLDEYRKEVKERWKHGEYSYADSMKVNESEVYFTPANRKVYGGGGIIPDVFVRLDSLSADPVMREIRKRNLIDGFAIKYADMNEIALYAKYASIENFMKEYMMSSSDRVLMREYLKLRGIELTEKNRSTHEEYIERRFRTMLARVVYGYDALYKVNVEYDQDILAALKEIDSGTIAELGLK